MAICLAAKALPPEAFTTKGNRARYGSTLGERMENQIIVRGDCHIWTGAKDPAGYGTLAVRHDGRKWFVHHLAWVREGGIIPAGKLLRHMCDNPACCNPRHLELGDDRDNKYDSVRRVRHVHGETHPSAKLTESDVLAIRNDPRSYPEIAEQYGIGISAVFAAKNGITWKNVAGPVGEARAKAKLTPECVREIRASSENGKALAARYGVSKATVSLIRLGKRWAHIT